MRGEAIEAVKEGINLLASTLRQDPFALETVCLSIITFDNDARQIVPLTEVYNFRMPEIQASGKSALGAALQLLAEKIDTEIVKTTPEAKGDWKPLVFIMIDGGHSGGYKKNLAELKKRKVGMIVSCAMSESVHIDVLKQISDNVIQMSKADGSTIKSFFKWVSSSVSAGSQKIDSNIEINTIGELPRLPIETLTSI
jgi:uncharacterized protein YegL